MSDQLRAAAKRWIEWDGDEDDADDVCREYLRLYDPTPITAEWLRSVGFESLAGMCLTHGRLEYWPTMTDAWYCDGRQIVFPQPVTHGDLRRLASTLAIELKEDAS